MAHQMIETAAERGRLETRPVQPTQEGEVGLHKFGPDDARYGLVYVPSGYDPARPAPMAVMLHGAGGNAQQGISLLVGLADRHGLVLVAPEARDSTWDVIRGGYGQDVEVIDSLLRSVFDRYAVDPEHLAIGGFSDGASYALSLGTINGDLFTHTIAFSPGFMAPTERHDSPRFFISHGTHDSVLNIDRCSRRIVPKLRAEGYDVDYREFDGGHTVPPFIGAAAVAWFTGG